MKILHSILVGTVLAADQFNQKDCPEHGLPCTREYRPICGNDGKTYGSACMARFSFCNGNSNLEIAHTGPCPTPPTLQNEANVDADKSVDVSDETEDTRECNNMCTKEYAPVCGSDNVKYDNDCKLKFANCESATEIRKLHDGLCQETIETFDELDCPLKCKNASLGKKVCGNNGVTYNSICHLKKDNCKSEMTITKLHKGKCKKMQNDAPVVPTVPAVEKCPLFCRRMLAPVCGSDYQTYGNDCTLRKFACDNPDRALYQLHEGQCECPDICPNTKDAWNPICGTDNEDYPSPCELKRASCEGDPTKSLGIAKYGPCDQTAVLVEPDNVQLKLNKCDCPESMQRNYAPICGKDGNTYQNECEAKCQGTEMERHGACEMMNDFMADFFNDVAEENAAEAAAAAEAAEFPVYEVESVATTEAPTCQKICIRMMDPTCGYSKKEGYKMYSSPCMMEVLSCEAGAPATKSNDAVCGKKILKSGQSHYRFFKTGCTAIDLEAEIVDESFCEEVEEVEDTRVMPNDVGVDAGEPKEDKGKKNKKNKKDRQNNIWNHMPSWRVPGWGRRKRATQNE